MRVMKFNLFLFVCVFLTSCEKNNSEVDNLIKHLNDKDSSGQSDLILIKPAQVLTASDFKTVEWTELIPKSDLDAILSPPSYVSDVEDGSFDDQISSAITQAIDSANNDEYQNALVSTTIMPEMNDKPIRIPGFVVPLEYDDEQGVISFFLVPYFGACIHTPPPPPNQLIYVESSKGIKIDVSYDAFWISGVLKTSLIQNEMATAAYSMQLQNIETYQGD